MNCSVNTVDELNAWQHHGSHILLNKRGQNRKSNSDLSRGTQTRISGNCHLSGEVRIVTLGVPTGSRHEGGSHLECGNVLDLDLGDAYILQNYAALGGEWVHVYVWLSPFTVHLKSSQHCLLISYTPIQNKD